MTKENAFDRVEAGIRQWSGPRAFVTVFVTFILLDILARLAGVTTLDPMDGIAVFAFFNAWAANQRADDVVKRINDAARQAGYTVD